MSAKRKYESIDRSKLNKDVLRLLDLMKKKTDNFENEDVVKASKVEGALDRLIAKYPDAVKKSSSKSKPKAKAKAKKPAKSKQPSKSKPKRETVMTVAKRIRKDGEKWQDALKRAKSQMGKETKKSKTAVESEMSKLKKLISEDSVLKGFNKSDIQRDAVRKAKPRGKRKTSTKGETTNQYGTFKNKVGRPYWESRENRSDRYAPSYPKNKPFLEDGGLILGGSTTLRDNGDIMPLGTANADAVFEAGGVTGQTVVNPNEAMADLTSTYGFDDVYAKGGKVRNTENNLRTFFTFDGEDFAILGGHLYGTTEGDNEFRLIDNINYAPKEVQVAYYEKMRGFAKGGEVEYPFDDEVIIRNYFGGDRKKFEESQKEYDRKRNEPLPFEKGGEMKQGYNDRLNESLGNRDGAEDMMMQSYKDRRDESKGMEKSMGRRAYQSVGTMDKMTKGGEVKQTIDSLKKGDEITIKFGSSISKDNSVDLKVRSRNKVRKGTIDKITFENLKNPKGVKFYAYERGKSPWFFAMGDMAISNIEIVSYKSMAKGGKIEVGKKYSATFSNKFKKRVPTKFEVISKFKGRDNMPMVEILTEDGRRANVFETDLKPLMFAKGGDIKNGDVVMVKEPNYGYNADYYVVDDKAGYDEDGYLLSDTMKRESSVFEKEDLEKIYAKGGEMKQGYNDRLNESLGNRDGAEDMMMQSYKDRRDESKGMEKSMGRRAYQSVGTMDDVGNPTDPNVIEEMEIYIKKEIPKLDKERFFTEGMKRKEAKRRFYKKFGYGAYNPRFSLFEKGGELILGGATTLRDNGDIMQLGIANSDAVFKHGGAIHEMRKEKDVDIYEEQMAEGGKLSESESKKVEMVKKFATGYVGNDFLEKNPSDKDILRMIELKDSSARVHNSTRDLRQQYGLKYKKGGEIDAFTMSMIKGSGDITELETKDAKIKMAKGGKIGFDGLAKKVAKSYVGKKVPKKFQNQYGKTYSPAEAKEVGDKVAGAVYRMQQAKKMAKGGEIGGYKIRGYETEDYDNESDVDYVWGTKSEAVNSARQHWESGDYDLIVVQMIEDEEEEQIIDPDTIFEITRSEGEYEYAKGGYLDKRKGGRYVIVADMGKNKTPYFISSTNMKKNLKTNVKNAEKLVKEKFGKNLDVFVLDKEQDELTYPYYKVYPKSLYAKGGEIEEYIVIHTSMKPESFIKKHKLSNYEYEIDESDYDGFSRINFETYPKNQNFIKDKSIKEFYYEPYEEYAKGGMVDVIDERSVGKMKIIVLNDGKTSRTLTFKDGVENNFNRNKQKDKDKLWELSSKVPFGKIIDKKYKFKKGGKTQGYNDKLNESLGDTKGKRSTKEQNYKDRRNESEAMEKKEGKRKYSRVKTMDKGSRKLKKPNSFFAVVKRKQKKGEAWKDAIQRVKNEMKK